VLPLLLQAMSAKVKLADLERVAEIERRCLPALAWLSRSGAPLDRAAWEAQARAAEREAEDLAGQLAAAAPPRPGYLPGTTATFPSSPNAALGA
jgi:hypothetical protein